MQKVNLRITALLLFMFAAIVSTAAMRFVSFEIPVFSNFTPMGALALFGGTYFADKWKACLASVLTIFVTDIFINYLWTAKITFWHSYSIPVYLSFIGMVFIGGLLKKVNITSVLLASLAAVTLHWLITDIEPWLNSSLYAKGLAGYAESLIMALPFERNMLFADAFFGAVLFGGFEWLKSRSRASAYKKEMAV